MRQRRSEACEDTRQAFGKLSARDGKKKMWSAVIVSARDVTNLTHEFVTHYGKFWLCGGSFPKMARTLIIPLPNNK